MSLDKRNILLVSSAFTPELSPRSFRATELAKEFSIQGHRVTVFTKTRDHDYTDFLKSFPMTIKTWNKSIFRPIPSFRNKYLSFLSRILTRILGLLFEYPAIVEMFQVKKLLKGEIGYDLMISFAVPFPVHWGVAWARSKKNIIADIWIADCGDPYMLGRIDTFRKPFYFKYFEINFCRKCDFLTVPFDGMKEQFYPQFIGKIKTIPQGINFNEIKKYDGKIINEKPVFVFAGTVIPGLRDLSLFLNYLSTLNIDFLFNVYTNQIEWFSNYKELLGEKLSILGYIDRLSLIYKMSKTDFLVNVDTKYDSMTNVEAIPSKLIDYALSGRPILNINSANLDTEMVNEFLNKNYSRRRKINIEAYDIKVVSEAFLKLLNHYNTSN